ncbi:putative membrane protein [Helicobacter pylori Hp P-16]|nr:putative membrane protein [Helicobacter pylori Hp P-16]
MRFFICFVLYIAQNLFCFITFRFLAWWLYWLKFLGLLV